MSKEQARNGKAPVIREITMILKAPLQFRCILSRSRRRWEVATSRSTCLCSRLTGQVPYQDFTFPITAFIRHSVSHSILVRLLWGAYMALTIPSTAQRTARLLVLGFELADHSLGLVLEGGDDLVGVLFRVGKSQAADREIDDFRTVPRSPPECREARPVARTSPASHPASRRWKRRELPSRDRVRAGPAA